MQAHACCREEVGTTVAGPRLPRCRALRGTPENPLTIARGLWGLGFGNDGAAGSATTLYFATDVAIGDSLHGLFGKLVPAHAANRTDVTDGAP